METKVCSYHKVEHLISEFSRRALSPDGLESACKERRSSLAREYRRNNPSKPRPVDQIFSYNLKKNYGISPEQYQEMVVTQCGQCAVCGEPEKTIDPKSGNTKRLSVHHNHDSGVVIALCCSECNMGMGKLKDSAALLRRAADLMDMEAVA